MRVEGWQTPRRSQSKVMEPAFAGAHEPASETLVDESQVEHAAGDPKVCELYASRVKLGEILVEARHRSNVQIDCLTCVKGRKTNRAD